MRQGWEATNFRCALSRTQVRADLGAGRFLRVFNNLKTYMANLNRAGPYRKCEKSRQQGSNRLRL
jgi:uncharacterized FlgJ-related protein